MKDGREQKLPRSMDEQIEAMAKDWPSFEVIDRYQHLVIWQGQITGFQRPYLIKITWAPRWKDRPYVQLIDPPLEPFENDEYVNIPHLMFDDSDPKMSGLCLFDSDGGEWNPSMLIAETTVPWAAKWLHYYNLWLYDRVWRGGGVGAESVGALRAQALHAQKS